MEDTERLFLGLHLTPLFREAIEDCAMRLKPVYSDHKWVNLENVHFTIHFLGDVAAERKPSIIETARAAAAATPAFEIGLKDMGAFPDRDNPRVIWIGAAPFCRQNLQQLYERVSSPLIEAGFPAEYPQFTPHATLFRVRADEPIVWDERAFFFPETVLGKAEKLILFKSVKTAKGTEYIPVEQYPFG